MTLPSTNVELVGLTKTYADRAVVDDLSLTLPDGSLTVLVGPSGCGKSTTLRIVAGLETADDGTVSIGGRDVTAESPRTRDIAMVFQNYALYPHLTVAANIAFPLRNNGVARTRRPGGPARPPNGSASPRCSTASRVSSPGASSSASPSRGRWCAPPRCSCSTSR